MSRASSKALQVPESQVVKNQELSGKSGKSAATFTHSVQALQRFVSGKS
jgi:hypothetical protein